MIPPRIFQITEMKRYLGIHLLLLFPVRPERRIDLPDFCLNLVNDVLPVSIPKWHAKLLSERVQCYLKNLHEVEYSPIVLLNSETRTGISYITGA